MRSVVNNKVKSSLKVLGCKILVTIGIPFIIAYYLPKAIYNIVFKGLKVYDYLENMLQIYTYACLQCNTVKEEDEK